MRDGTGPRSAFDDVESWFDALAAEGGPVTFRIDGWPAAVQATDAGPWSGGDPARRMLTHTTSTGVAIATEALCHTSHGVVEWTPSLKCLGADGRPRVSDVRSLDAFLSLADTSAITLHRWRGSSNRRDDFGPVLQVPHFAGSMDDWFAPAVGEAIKRPRGHDFEIPGRDERLVPVSKVRFGPAGGRSSDTHFPLFEVAWDGGGLIVIVGWTGQWFAEVERTLDGLRISVGLEHLDARLRSEELISLPRVAVMGWRGDRVVAYNRVRTFVRERILPRVDGELPEAPLAGSGFLLFDQGIAGTAARHIELMRSYKDRGLPIDTYWIDAGWFGGPDSWVRSVGDWFPDPSRFPNGLREVADVAHANGWRFLAWFEPERVYAGTELHRDHPEWLIGIANEPEFLLDLGIPAAREWITDRVSKLIESEAIDIYRQDLNFAPLPYWLANDEPDRLGITEVRHVEGLYAFWDALRARHPQLVIDNCAGGGRRIDLGTMSRSIALTRSDYLFEPDGTQAQTWGISHLLPLWGVTLRTPDEYEYRSGIGGGLVILGDTTAADDPLTRRLIEEYREVRPYALHGDVYPLTDYSIGFDTWMVIRFDRPERRRGVVLAFRRTHSPFPEARVPFGPVVQGASYDLNGAGDPTRRTAADLARDGLTLRLESPASSVIIRYRW